MRYARQKDTSPSARQPPSSPTSLPPYQPDDTNIHPHQDDAEAQKPQSELPVPDLSFWNFYPTWPPDSLDQHYSQTPSYQNFTIYTITLLITILAPLLAISIYGNFSLEVRCRHPRLNNYVTATVTVYMSLLTGLLLARFYKRKWQGRRAEYFARFTVVLCIYIGIFVGGALSFAVMSECENRIEIMLECDGGSEWGSGSTIAI